MKDNIREKNKTNQSTLGREYISAVGRRKNATALVRLYINDVALGGVTIRKGEITVNNKKAFEYFGRDRELIYKEPLHATNTENKFAVSIKVTGGGKMGQMDAVVLGIARALDKFDREKFHTILKRKGMLTRDPRVRERRKVGMGGKSRRKKQSPKR